MPRDTRLAPLLFRTHAALVLLTAAAVAVPLGGLVRARALLTEIRDTHFVDIGAEEAIHRAAWRVEVVARHATRACLADPTTDEQKVLPAVLAADRELGDALDTYGPRAPARLLRPARGYRDLVRRTQPPGACRALNALAGERLLLDEELTNAWIERLRELHGAVSQSERLAGATVAGAEVAAAVLGLAGVLAAAALARRAARRLAAPLRAASDVAVRLGRGDFSPVHLPSEIDEVRALAEALERMRHDLEAVDRMKQQILAAVSHELHTPLGKLREALGLLADGTAGPLTPRQARVVQLAREACEREVRTVSELLDVSRLRSGQPLRRQAGCDLDEVLRAAAEAERPEAEARGVPIELDAQGPPLSLTLDVPLVERAVANLLRNAASVSPRGAPVRLRRAALGPDGRVRIEVADQGPGLPEPLRADPFRAFDSAPVGARGAGLGLGLALSREVARAHGGDLVVLESSAAGTRFELSLPAAEAPGAVHNGGDGAPER